MAHPFPLPSVGEVQGVCDQLVPVLRHFGVDPAPLQGMRVLAATPGVRVTLSRQAFLRLLAARLLHLLESAINPALAAMPLFQDGTWKGLVQQFFDDQPFLDVRRNT